MKYTKYPELKNELKSLAKEIKKLKYKRDNWWEFRFELPTYLRAQAQSVFMAEQRALSWKFRNRHVAYCLLNGRKYEEIEQPGESNPLSWLYVDEILYRYGRKAKEFRPVQYAK